MNILLHHCFKIGSTKFLAITSKETSNATDMIDYLASKYDYNFGNQTKELIEQIKINACNVRLNKILEINQNLSTKPKSIIDWENKLISSYRNYYLSVLAKIANKSLDLSYAQVIEFLQKCLHSSSTTGLNISLPFTSYFSKDKEASLKESTSKVIDFIFNQLHTSEQQKLIVECAQNFSNELYIAFSRTTDIGVIDSLAEYINNTLIKSNITFSDIAEYAELESILLDKIEEHPLLTAFVIKPELNFVDLEDASHFMLAPIPIDAPAINKSVLTRSRKKLQDYLKAIYEVGIVDISFYNISHTKFTAANLNTKFNSEEIEKIIYGLKPISVVKKEVVSSSEILIQENVPIFINTLAQLHVA